MSLPPLQYNFHDSLILDAVFEQADLSLSVRLYSIYYPDAPVVIVRFRDVFNVHTVATYVNRMREEADADSNLAMIYALAFDDKKASTDKDLYMFLQTELGHVRIHCRALDVK